MSGYNCSTICTLSINLSRIYMITRIVMQVYTNAMCSSCYSYWSEFIEYCYFRYALVCSEAGGLYTVTWSMAGSRVQTGCNDRKDWIRLVWFEFLWCYCLRSNFSLRVVSYFCEKFMSDQWNGTIMYVPCTCMCVYVLYVCDCCHLMCS